MNTMSSESPNVTNSEKWITNSDLANQVISKYTTNTKNSAGSASNNPNITNSEKWITNSDLANQVISKYTTNTKNSAGAASTKRKMPAISKDDEEYAKKRERNNVAVKKSREKAKNRIQETQSRVEQLSKENEELQTKVTLLSKELNVLRALFTNGGFTLPGEFQFTNSNNSVNGSEHSHSPSMDNVVHHLEESSSRQSQHSNSLPIKQEKSKSAFHSIEESKIPPLRPMPRVANSSSNQKSSEHHSPIRSYGALPPSRDSLYSYKSGSDYSNNDSKQQPPIPPPIVMMQHGQPVTTHSNSPYSSNHYKSLSEMQHTSVIRSASEVGIPNNMPSHNTLGKFCIIQDPENNGQVKIVPISS